MGGGGGEEEKDGQQGGCLPSPVSIPSLPSPLFRVTTEKSLSLTLPCSALPPILSRPTLLHRTHVGGEGGGGVSVEQWSEAKAANITQLMRAGFQRNVVLLVCYHLSSRADMLIRSMSALESPPPPSSSLLPTILCFNRCLEADGGGGGAHAFHAVSGRGAADGGGAALVLAYLFTLLAASMLLLQKLEVELFLLLLVELLELLLQEERRDATVSLPVPRSQNLEPSPHLL